MAKLIEKKNWQGLSVRARAEVSKSKATDTNRE